MKLYTWRMPRVQAVSACGLLAPPQVQRAACIALENSQLCALPAGA
ncbi:hypothetical protein [Microcoleus sp. herbarium14]